MVLTREVHPSIHPDKTYVYMSNHQSLLDVALIYGTCPATHLRMIGKQESFDHPVWGKSLHTLGMVPVKRGDSKSAIANLKNAERTFAKGVSLWIAPEGTRSRDGALAKLRKGGFHLAKGGGVEIVPVAISGMRRVLPPGSKHVSPGLPVKTVYGKPIPCESRTIEDLVDEVERFYQLEVLAH